MLTPVVRGTIVTVPLPTHMASTVNLFPVTLKVGVRRFLVPLIGRIKARSPGRMAIDGKLDAGTGRGEADVPDDVAAGVENGVGTDVAGAASDLGAPGRQAEIAPTISPTTSNVPVCAQRPGIYSPVVR